MRDSIRHVPGKTGRKISVQSSPMQARHGDLDMRHFVRDKKKTPAGHNLAKAMRIGNCGRSSGLWLECSEGPQSGYSEVFPDVQEHRRLGIRDPRLLTLIELSCVLRNPNQ